MDGGVRAADDVFVGSWATATVRHWLRSRHWIVHRAASLLRRVCTKRDRELACSARRPRHDGDDTIVRGRSDNRGEQHFPALFLPTGQPYARDLHPARSGRLRTTLAPKPCECLGKHEVAPLCQRSGVRTRATGIDLRDNDAAGGVGRVAGARRFEQMPAAAVAAPAGNGRHASAGA